jgi:hypothetical protein
MEANGDIEKLNIIETETVTKMVANIGEPNALENVEENRQENNEEAKPKETLNVKIKNPEVTKTDNMKNKVSIDNEICKYLLRAN